MCEQVNETRRVCICGNQLILSIIGASLEKKPEFEVQRMEDFPTDCIPPDVILFDLSAEPPHFPIRLLLNHPTMRAIGVDLANSRMLLLCGREFRFFTEEDLVQVIKGSASVTRGGKTDISHIRMEVGESSKKE